jgi:hypothetical protein
MVALHQRIYRGEIRGAFPTYEHPDPAAHAAEDPEGFLHKWMQPHYPFPKGWTGDAPTVGQHWTRSPQAIPERFVEPMLHQAQPGVPMGKREQTAVMRREATEQDTGGPGYGMPGHEEHRAMMDKFHSYAERAEREGINTYHDLSGGDPDRPGKARKYNMAVVWEGQQHERGETGTNYEDETNIPFGEHVTVTGARLYVPKSGSVHDFGQRHPSPFTSEERAFAHHETMNRSGYSAINPSSSVPWSRIQFANAVELKVGRNPGQWSR